MIKNVVFDVGRVLIAWNPYLLYREVFKTDEEVDAFFKKIDFYNWNLSMDAGKSFAQGVAEKVAEFPMYEKEIRLFDEGWEKTVPNALVEPVAVLKKLKQAGYPVYALTNFSKEKFEKTLNRFDFFKCFDGIVVSAEEKMVKPDLAFFDLLCKRYHLKPEETLFIDDSEVNIEGAKVFGLQTILFKYPDLLEPQLNAFGVLK
ncbi:MAG: HAD family phosphatase [Alphaproteobacteria bacterium]|nr:HAD family phosphatase [Alphaproteobacteria bacterium]